MRLPWCPLCGDVKFVHDNPTWIILSGVPPRGPQSKRPLCGPCRLAIRGDRTEHVLWRLENGNVENIVPKIAVVMIGTNNHMSSPPPYTARDIGLIVQTLRRKLPSTKVLVLAIFPRGAGPEDAARQINEQVNALLETQIAALGDPKVSFANFSRVLFKSRNSKTQSGRVSGRHAPE